MKIFLIVLFYLISGPVNCSDVIGYSGGSIILLSNINWSTHNSKYICKVEGNDCSDIIRADTKLNQVQNGRFLMYSDQDGVLLVLIRNLKPQDAGTYKFGSSNQNGITANLKVYNNASCGVPRIMNAYLGKNISITCNYPGEYEKKYKYIYTVDDDNFMKVILHTETNVQNGRFSISDDRSAKVLSVNFSNVTETDEMVCLFGVWIGEGSVQYYSFFAEMWLHITGTESPSPACFSYTVIITVCVCMALVLIGGFGLLIFMLKCKMTRGSRPSSRRNTEAFNKAHSDPGNNQADYECLDPETQLTSVYDTIQV